MFYRRAQATRQINKKLAKQPGKAQAIFYTAGVFTGLRHPGRQSQTRQGDTNQQTSNTVQATVKHSKTAKTKLKMTNKPPKSHVQQTNIPKPASPSQSSGLELSLNKNATKTGVSPVSFQYCFLLSSAASSSSSSSSADRWNRSKLVVLLLLLLSERRSKAAVPF